MEGSRKKFHRIVFDNICLKSKRTAFQDFFADIMECAHPGDFVRTRTAGNKGDRGCDGFLRSTRTVFQVYAPREGRGLSELHKKMEKDLEEAKSFFGDIIQGWIFVHNDSDGISTDTCRLLEQLADKNEQLEFGFWTTKDLWKQVAALTGDDLAELLPGVPPNPQIDAESLFTSESRSAQSISDTPIESPRKTTIASSDTLPAQRRILTEQIDAQEKTIRQYLDKEGRRLWDDIKKQLGELSYQKAIAAGGAFEEWLHRDGTKASRVVRGRAFMLLADLALVALPDDSTRDATNTTDARKYYERARDEFGSDILDEDSDRLLSLGAKLEAVIGNFADAFARIEGVDSPAVFSLRLAMLIEQEDWKTAANILRNKTLHERWAAISVIVHAMTDEHDRAMEVLEWSKHENRAVYHLGLLHFTWTSVGIVQGDLNTQGPVLSSDLTPDARSRLEEALKLLHPVLCEPEATARVRNGVEADSLGVAILISYLLGDSSKCRTYCELLRDYDPVHLAFARAVRAGVVDTPKDLPDRLRRDHGTSREALTLAASIEGIYLGRAKEAIAAVQELAENSASIAEKEDLCNLLGDLATHIGPEVRAKIDQFMAEQLGSRHRLVLLREVVRLISEGNLSKAESQLEELPAENDPIWWQVTAKLRSMRNDKSGAAEAQCEAARILPHIEVQKYAAQLAEEADRPDLLEPMLERIVTRAPDDEAPRFRLASLNVDREEYAKAIGHFEKLWRQRPDEPAFGLSLAISLRNDGRADESLALLEGMCDAHPSNLHAILWRARILREKLKPDRAFESLQRLRGSFWDNEDFLLAFVDFGYTAGRDDVAHEALSHLIELQQQGKVSPQKLWSASLEETVDLFKQQHQHLRSANREVLRSRFPWLAVEHRRRFPSYLGWRYRTQPLHVLDDPESRAAFAIYSTHHFTLAEHNNNLSLEEVECPPRGSEVAIDMTALITLHRLGFLDRAVDYFGVIRIPSLYIQTLERDRSNLASHQPSRVKASEALENAISTRRIITIPDMTAATERGLAIVLEYSEETEETPIIHRLTDLFSYLCSAGHISRSDLDRARRYASSSSKGSDSPSQPLAENGIFSDVGTLMTICAAGLLDVAVGSVSIHISEHDANEIKWENHANKGRKEVLNWHEDLARIVLDEDRFTRTGRKLPEARAQTEENLNLEVPILAVQLALERNISLFADDRFCQAVTANTRRGDVGAAFGTDAFIVALHQDAKLTLAETADAFRTLLKWRYRFLVPPDSILLHFASEYCDHPPGAPLVEFAQYLHDSMRDPGLLFAAEATKPPMSMAAKYWQSWVIAIARFLIRLRYSSNINEKAADAITCWAVNEFIPIPPRCIHPAARQQLEKNAGPQLLASMLAYAITAQDEKASNQAIVAVKEALGLSDLDYIRLVGDNLNVLCKR